MKVCHAVLLGRRNSFTCLPLVKAARGSTALFKVTATFQLNLCNCFNSIYEHKLKLVETPLSQNSSNIKFTHTMLQWLALSSCSKKVRGSNSRPSGLTLWSLHVLAVVCVASLQVLQLPPHTVQQHALYFPQYLSI